MRFSFSTRLCGTECNDGLAIKEIIENLDVQPIHLGHSSHKAYKLLFKDLDGFREKLADNSDGSLKSEAMEELQARLSCNPSWILVIDWGEDLCWEVIVHSSLKESNDIFEAISKVAERHEQLKQALHGFSVQLHSVARYGESRSRNVI